MSNIREANMIDYSHPLFVACFSITILGGISLIVLSILTLKKRSIKMNDMRPIEILFNALIACGSRPEKVRIKDKEFIINNVVVYEFDNLTGKLLRTLVRKNKRIITVDI